MDLSKFYDIMTLVNVILDEDEDWEDEDCSDEYVDGEEDWED